MSERLDAAFAAARDHFSEKDQRIQLLETAMATVMVNLRRAPEKAPVVAVFASAILRGLPLQEAVTEAEQANDPSSIVEVSASPVEGLTSGEGLKLVPIEPTEAMLDAYWKQTGESQEMRSRTHAYMRRYWSAMLAASPATHAGSVREAEA